MKEGSEAHDIYMPKFHLSSFFVSLRTFSRVITIILFMMRLSSATTTTSSSPTVNCYTTCQQFAGTNYGSIHFGKKNAHKDKNQKMCSTLMSTSSHPSGMTWAKKLYSFTSNITLNLLLLQFLWILPYLMVTNYLERSLLPFRFLCYTEPNLLSVEKPYRGDFNQCVNQFFPNRQSEPTDCQLNTFLVPLIKPNISKSIENVIVVRSAPASRDYRDYIRDTWKKTSEPEIPVVFVCGKGNYDLKNEESVYQDILQLDFIDSYKNLTLKMMGIYDYFIKNSQVEEIIVINDDTIVNATSLKELTRKKYTKPTMIGKVSRGYPRLFFKWLPWYVSSETYKHKCYPPFIQGSSFIINRPAAQLIHDNICRFPFVHLDDVFMGIITNCLEIKNQHEEGFDHHWLTEFVVFHYQYSRYTANQMRSFWKQIQNKL